MSERITKYESLTDEALYGLAKKLQVEIKKNANRDAVEKLVYEAEMQIEKGKQNTGEDLKDERVTLKYIGKGTTTIFKKKWSGKKQCPVSEKEARELLHRFPKRFVKVSNKEDKK